MRVFFFSSRRRHTRCALVTGVQTCALPIFVGQSKLPDSPFGLADWSVKAHIDGDWKVKVATRIRSVDIIAVICGEHTNTAVGVSAELKIAHAEGKPYFLLAGYKDKTRSEEHTSELQSLMRISYAVFCLQKKK